MPKVTDSGAAQAQPVPASAVSHEATISTGATSGVQDGTHQGLERSDTGSSGLDGDELTATTGINAAKLIQTMGQTGMNVAMRSNEFGNISIHTSVSQQQMLAQISLDHGDLSQALASHVSSVQTKLENESGLHTVDSRSITREHRRPAIQEIPRNGNKTRLFVLPGPGMCCASG